jgi:hypothetical protein
VQWIEAIGSVPSSMYCRQWFGFTNPCVMKRSPDFTPWTWGSRLWRRQHLTRQIVLGFTEVVGVAVDLTGDESAWVLQTIASWSTRLSSAVNTGESMQSGRRT